MHRKLLAILLAAVGALAFYQTGRSLWWIGLFEPPAPPITSPASAAFENEAVSLEVRLGASRFFPGREQIVPMKLTLVGRDRPRQPALRLPLNVALVIDRSGSMEQEGRMEQVRRTVDLLLDRLQTGDRVALVSYSTGVTVHSGSREPLDKQKLREMAWSIQPSGGTNLYAGLEAGCAEVQSAMGPGVNRVLLFSDGLANIGVREPRDIMLRLQPCLASGVTMTSVGVGADFNENLMAEVAEMGRGNFYFVERPEEMAPSIARELEELGSMVAHEGVLELQLPVGVSLEKVYGYQHEVQGQSVRIPLKDVYAGERRKILVELRVAPAPGDRELCAVVRPILRYQGADRVARSLEADRALGLTRAVTEAELRQDVDAEVAEEVVYTRNSLAVEEASRLMAAGQQAEAQVQLEQAITSTRGAPTGKGKVGRQRAELEKSLEWVKGASAGQQQKIAAKRMKTKARDYAKD